MRLKSIEVEWTATHNMRSYRKQTSHAESIVKKREKEHLRSE